MFPAVPMTWDTVQIDESPGKGEVDSQPPAGQPSQPAGDEIDEAFEQASLPVPNGTFTTGLSSDMFFGLKVDANLSKGATLSDAVANTQPCFVDAVKLAPDAKRALILNRWRLRWWLASQFAAL